ncbi:MAG TPA: methyltransferase domain-containing protein [Anaerolineales bacterium]|nr:methyltransferase domain-containing protein [Anaerolineales bacterium]
MNLDTVRQTFTDWAPFYDPTHGWTLPKRRAARLALDLQPGDRVLDLGCGTGLNFPHLRELVGAHGQVVGVDLTPAMLDIARKMIKTKGWKNVEVHEADAAHLPFPDASFDKVIITFALTIIPEYISAIEEVRRILIPGGQFVALEMRAGIHSLPAWLQPLPHICAVDMSHDSLKGIQQVFQDVEVRYYWLGMIFVVVAKKK